MNKISTKLMLVFVVVSIFPLLAIGLIAVDKSKQAIRFEVENTLNTFADYKLLQIQKYLIVRNLLRRVLKRWIIWHSMLKFEIFSITTKPRVTLKIYI